MLSLRTIKKNASQIGAITEKNLRLELRYKFGFFWSYITPIIQILFPLIIMGRLFNYNNQFGAWTSATYPVFVFMAYQIILLKSIITKFPKRIKQEKFWQTLPALIIAPFNKFNFLLGVFTTHLITVSIPFVLFFIIIYIIYPVSILTILFVIVIFFLIELVFSGIGMIFAIFAISKESLWQFFIFGLNWIFWFSCITYPFEIFPSVIQNLINLNPLYYIFDILRISWIENNLILSLSLHFFSFIILISLSIITPIIGVYIFNIIFKKYGIIGY